MLAFVRAFNIKTKMAFEVHIHFWLSKIAMQEFDVFASACRADISKAHAHYVCSTPLDYRKRILRKGDVDVLASAREDYIFSLASEGRDYISLLVEKY